MNWNLVSKYRTQLMGIACIWIMLFHNRSPWSGDGVINYILSKGNVGVDMFMFLSGVGSYYSFRKTPDVAAFYKKRSVRILFPYLLFAVPFCWWRSHIPGAELSFWNHLLWVSFVKNGITTTWFIPAILGLYLLFPVIYFLQNEPVSIGGRVIHRNVITLLIMLVCFLSLRYIMSAHPAVWKNTEIALTRSLIFIVGCYCAKWVYEGKPLPPGSELGSLIWIIIYLFVFFKEVKLGTFWIRLTYGPYAIACIIFGISVMRLLDKDGNGRRFRVLSFIGERTLELYLTHVMIRNIYAHYWKLPHFEESCAVDSAVIILSSIIVSTAGHWIVGKLTNMIYEHHHKAEV